MLDVELTKNKLIQWLDKTKNLWLLELLENMRQNLNKESTNKRFTAIQLDTRNFKFNREEANER